jgi:oligopeptide/dipeptide ABC transporter ATP-binding protein
MTALLEVHNLQVHYPGAGPRPVVRNLSMHIAAGTTLGLVGESGSGKSTTGRAILQLLRPTAGRVIFDGVDLTTLWQRRLGQWRWGPALRHVRRDMQIIFQDPYASLNPRMTVEAIVGEPLAIFGLAHGAARRARVGELLRQVGLDASAQGRYPHAFSGGQRQRIGIARALALEPKLIIADEPISALDVSIQAQILNLLADLKADHGLTLLFIAHDLAAVRQICDRVAVMYAGEIVEQGACAEVFAAPQHPYTQALWTAVPRPFVPRPDDINAQNLPAVTVADATKAACVYFGRCPQRQQRCHVEAPTLRRGPGGSEVACHFPVVASPPR